MTVANELKGAPQRELAVLTGTREEVRLKARLAKADARSSTSTLRPQSMGAIANT
jgi:hypothetical protein